MLGRKRNFELPLNGENKHIRLSRDNYILMDDTLEMKDVHEFLIEIEKVEKMILSLLEAKALDLTSCAMPVMLMSEKKQICESFDGVKDMWKNYNVDLKAKEKKIEKMEKYMKDQSETISKLENEIKDLVTQNEIRDQNELTSKYELEKAIRDEISEVTYVEENEEQTKISDENKRLKNENLELKENMRMKETQLEKFKVDCKKIQYRIGENYNVDLKAKENKIEKMEKYMKDQSEVISKLENEIKDLVTQNEIRNKNELISKYKLEKAIRDEISEVTYVEGNEEQTRISDENKRLKNENLELKENMRMKETQLDKCKVDIKNIQYRIGKFVTNKNVKDLIKIKEMALELKEKEIEYDKTVINKAERKHEELKNSRFTMEVENKSCRITQKENEIEYVKLKYNENQNEIQEVTHVSKQSIEKVAKESPCEYEENKNEEINHLKETISEINAKMKMDGVTQNETLVSLVSLQEKYENLEKKVLNISSKNKKRLSVQVSNPKEIINDKREISETDQTDNDDCNSISKTDRNILLKYVTRKERGSFKCEKCGKIGTRKESLLNHVETIHFRGKFLYKCETCSKNHSNKKSLQNHIFRIHQDIPKKTP